MTEIDARAEQVLSVRLQIVFNATRTNARIITTSVLNMNRLLPIPLGADGGTTVVTEATVPTTNPPTEAPVETNDSGALQTNRVSFSFWKIAVAFLVGSSLVLAVVLAKTLHDNGANELAETLNWATLPSPSTVGAVKSRCRISSWVHIGRPPRRFSATTSLSESLI